jgi:hypothetical protein
MPDYLPPEVLNIPNEDGIEDEGFSTTAKAINTQGQIVGWTGGSNRPLYRCYDSPSTGYLINKDNSGYVNLSQEGVWVTFPMDINDSGVVVGAYVPAEVTIPEGPFYPPTAIPCHAFRINADGTGFKDLHPDGFIYSLARTVTPDGIIAGFYGEEEEACNPDLNPCLFDENGGISVDFNSELATEVSFSGVINDEYMLVTASYESDDKKCFILDYHNPEEPDSWQELPIDDIDFYDLWFCAINDNNQIVGCFLDYNIFAYCGFTYMPGDEKIRILSGKRSIGNWDYYEYELLGINNSGQIAGISYRDDNGGLSQARAMCIDWDFNNFRDITPEPFDGYSEAYDINDSGFIIGYGGFMQKHCLVLNRAFVTR